ncbi:immunity protein YezG family protein [Nocardia huaxiensis]|uniref:DUF600 family protein n=1 Tax=Nocardia huaxiensis TaxID=2755382 RepID=A0A7D6VDY9_9NOCA|nr:immunity protein YezG family protein [Nocardia huaxiensis]QLY32853.1 DUF600 family protein [Nocardia huaxiensis]UFS93392.1 antitoxin YezG family protein [Nocardia huaxiensis]
MADPTFDSPEADALLLEVGSNILRDREFADDYGKFRWEALSVVVRINDHAIWMNGYGYSDTGRWEARTPRSDDLKDKIRRLRAVMQKPGETAWQSCLIQLKRSDMALQIDFEYDDVDRWFDMMPRELMPQ